MWKILSFVLAIISVILTNNQCNGEEQLECVGNTGTSQETHLSITSTRIEGGEWDTIFSAERKASLSSDKVELDLNHVVTECSSYRVIKIRGRVKGNHGVPLISRILFHKKCSANAVITNDGRSLKKYSSNQPATALTNRPLMDNEMFSVRLDNKNPSYSALLGVTSHRPGSIDIPNHIYDLKSGTWLFIHDGIYQNGSLTEPKNYAKQHLNNAKVGDVFGVMRSKNGFLHLFVNGMDLGPAVPVPKNVYGVFELYNDGLEATIID